MKLFLASLALIGLIQASKAQNMIRGRNLSQQFSILCELFEVDVEYGEEDGSDTPVDFICEASMEGVKQTFTFEDPDGLLESAYYQKGRFLKLVNAVVDTNEFYISLQADTEIQSYTPTDERRILAPSLGVNSALIVRITYLGNAPSKSADQLAARFFGIGPATDGISAAERVSACSHGKLQVIPATGPGILDGIIEVSMDRSVSGTHSSNTLVNRVIEQLYHEHGDISTKYEFINFVLPTHDHLRWGNNVKYLAYATMAARKSVYRDVWSVHLDAIVHEWGHNLGLHHSGMDDHQYADTTGYMGYANGDPSGPIKCFNAQKHWLLGWYKDRSAFVTKEDLPYKGLVSFFGDYNSTKWYQNALLKFESRDKRLYLQYNLAEGINNETGAFQNRLVMVEDTVDPSFPYNPTSWIEAALLPGRSFRWPDYYDGRDLIIRVCSAITGTPNLLRVSAHIYGLQRDTCNQVWETPVCDDSKDAEFYVTEGLESKHCGWLARNLDKWGERLCVPGHAAYNLCEETCGKCADDCHDDASALFFVNDKQGEQNCQWLYERPQWQENLCHEGHDAYHLCPETCDVCDGSE